MSGEFGGRSKGHAPRFSADQIAAFATIVESGPDRTIDDVVRWWRIDLKRVIEERLGVVYHERTIGKLLKQIGFSHISARPQHPAQYERVVEMYKKIAATLKAHLTHVPMRKRIEIWFQML